MVTERYPEEGHNISEMPLEHNIEGNGNMMMMRPTWRMIEMLDLKGGMEAEGLDTEEMMNLATSR